MFILKGIDSALGQDGAERGVSGIIGCEKIVADDGCACLVDDFECPFGVFGQVIDFEPYPRALTAD